MNNENAPKQLSFLDMDDTLVDRVKVEVVNKATPKNAPKQTITVNDDCPVNSIKVEIPKDTNLNLIDREWSKYQVQADEFIPEAEPLLKIGDCPFISRGDIATIMGKPKSCKTFLVSALCGAAVCGEFLNIKSEVKNPKLILFDTEQGKARTQKVLQRINKIRGNPPEQKSDDVIVLSIRELSPTERFEVIQKAIIDNSPDIVCIDGGRDLLNNFNDIEASYSLVNELMKLSTECKCGIIIVIHQNKGDDNARGHLGSELMNKSVCIAEVKKTREVVAVSPIHCRDIPFDKFCFRINDAGLPEACDAPILKEEDSREMLKELFIKAMKDGDRMPRKDLISKLAEIMQKSDKSAQRKINDALKQKIIEQSGNKEYRLLSDEEDADPSY